MFRVYACVVILAVICQTVLGQNAGFPDEWEPSQLPRPDQNPQQCGLEQRSGFICDPDRILSPRSVELLDWLLRGFYDNDTVCPCSQYWCEKTQKGSHLSIAIVRKMKIIETFEDPDVAVMQSATNFALKLQERDWNFGQCDNDIVIFYSLDDGVLFISYGRTISQVISNHQVDYIQRTYGSLFRHRDDLLTGFIYVVLALRQSLNGYNYYDPSSPHFEQLVGGASHLTSGVLATMILALLSRLLASK